MAQASQNNSWVESYLDALLSYGLSSEYQNKPVHDKRLDAIDPDAQVFSKYYLSQILQLDEQGIRDAWHKAVSTRNYGQKDQRLEHLSWRVWFMKRSRSRVAWEEGRNLASTIPDESDTFDDYTSEEDDSVKGSKEGKESPKGPPGSPSKQLGSVFKPPAQDIPPIQEGHELQRAASAEQPDMLPSGGLNTGLYIILISMHGLVRGDRMELGKDPDTGGQVKYVVELARALAQHPAVFRVDLLTRKIKDSKVDSEYGQDEECLLAKEGLGGAFICRLPCGNEMQYLHKEALWPHVREFADRGLQHAQKTLKRLAAAHKPCELYVVHGHYADAGEVAALMSSSLGIDMVLTGHSLGRNKLEHLLASGTVNRKEIEMTYKISRRIEAEERALENAMMVFTSTQQEVDEQWGLYESFDAKMEAALRHRRRGGRHMPYMRVIPPGLDFSQLKVDLPKDPALEDFKHVKPAFGISPPASETGSPHSPSVNDDKETIKAPIKNVPKPQEGEDAPIWREVFRFLSNPRKPCILAMSRPDAKKNITTLVKAFGEHPQLRKLANLVLVMGNRETIDGMAGGSAKVIQQVLKLVDGYDLYGSVAYPKRHTQADISDIYRLPLATRGVFTNVALQEPFGLTVIEAAAHGVPTVATKNGGPVDIMATLHHGLLVDPANSNDIANACFKLLTNSNMWDQMSHNGVANIMAYSWPSHCKRYLDAIEAEKRYLRSQQPRSGVTGSLDHTKPFPGSGKASAHALVRVGSTPHGRHGHHSSHGHSRRASGKQSPKASPRGSTRITPTKPSKLGSDMGAVSSHFSGQLGFEAEEGEAAREHIIVVQYDGEAQTDAFLAIAKQASALVQGGHANLGMGVVSILGFDDSYRIFEAGGLEMEQLDWIVCNSGADIWHNFRDGQDEGKAGWHADESWEEHINFRWERSMIAKMVTKLLSGDKDMRPGASMDLGMSRALSSALGTLAPQESGTHPHHIFLAMSDELKQQIDMGARTRQKEAISNVIVERIRRRLRHNALRNHIVLQMVPEGEDLQSHMHITPCRASRALALRFLALKNELTMADMTVVSLPARVTHQDEDKIRVTGHTSDLSELISGLCKAIIVEPRSDARQARKSTAVDSALMDRLAVKVVPSLFDGRIQFLKNASELGTALKQQRSK